MSVGPVGRSAWRVPRWAMAAPVALALIVGLALYPGPTAVATVAVVLALFLAARRVPRWAKGALVALALAGVVAFSAAYVVSAVWGLVPFTP